MTKEDLLERVLDFGVKIIKLVNKLPKTPAGFKIGSQIVGSATSIGANTQEAQDASSKADFISKMSIALREAKESKFWLKLIKKSELLNVEGVDPELKEADELCAIYSTIVKNAKLNLSNVKSQMSNTKGFTLIELLVVISIIAILSVIGITAFQGTQAKARDSIRKNDLRTLATALEIYYQTNDSKYIGTPQLDGRCTTNTDEFYSQIASKINGSVPADPKPPNPRYLYTADNKCQSFRLCAKLENTSDPDINSICQNYNYGITPN